MEGESSPACVLSLIIPAYNEAEGIAQAVAEADAALESLGRPYEIIVVDDGSRDATADLVRTAIAVAARASASLRHVDNRGYGAALRTGFDAARGERVAFTDADCQFHLDRPGACSWTPRTACPIAVGYRVDRQDSLAAQVLLARLQPAGADAAGHARARRRLRPQGLSPRGAGEDPAGKPRLLRQHRDADPRPAARLRGRRGRRAPSAAAARPRARCRSATSRGR